MENLFLKLLIAISTLLGVSPIATQKEPIWEIKTPWTPAQGLNVFEANSSAIVAQCQKFPEHYVQFPPVIHGAHEIFLDGRILHTFGDPSFQSVRSFYGAPHVKCSDLKLGQTILWRVYSPSQYFARLSYFPEVISHRPRLNLFSESLNTIAVGTMFIMGFFSLLIFWGKVPKQLALSIALSNLFLSFYFAGTVSGFVGINLPMLTAHRLADLGVWLGVSFLLNALRIHGLIPRKAFLSYLAIVSVTLLIVAFGSSSDSIQFGTTLPFIPTLAIILTSVFRLGKTLFQNGYERKFLFAFVSLALFASVCLNDVFVVTGLSHGHMLLSVGFVFGLFFFALSVNEKINQTYQERDYLRSNLEIEVAKKTADLQKALEDLRGAQAEMVQSAKLASLGTLSAGIAHEINNSLNYVYGALKPIEKLVEQISDEDKKKRILSLTKIMGEGLKLTFDIIKSLKSYTGLNQAKFNDLKIKDVIDSVLTILRSKIRDKAEVVCDIAPELSVYGNVVGLNQVFMNLVSNAIDAMGDGGRLEIQASAKGGRVVISLKDSGGGIPEAIRDRIFEPFFTTKGVGKGTGLGLYIVKMEVERHQGKISIDSQPGVGTTFRIELPQVEAAGEERLAA